MKMRGEGEADRVFAWALELVRLAHFRCHAPGAEHLTTHFSVLGSGVLDSKAIAGIILQFASGAKTKIQSI